MTTMTTSLATTRTAADTAADDNDAKFKVLLIGVVIVFKSYSYKVKSHLDDFRILFCSNQGCNN